MRSAAARVLGVLAVTVSLLAVPIPAHAAPPPIWQITEVVQQAYPGQTGYVTFQPKCPSGQVPITGGYTASDGDVRRVAEKFEYADAGRYIVDLFSDGGYPQITARVWCVPSSYFSDVHQVAASFPVGGNNIAAGTVGCPFGEKALHASVTFSAVDSTVLTTYPNAGLGSWYVRGWNATVGSSMVVWVQCAAGAAFQWMRTVNSATPIGWGTPTSADCGAGMRPIAGGTYHSGDGGAISVQSRPVETTGSSGSHYWPEGGWRSVSLSLTGGYMITNVMCVPSTPPIIDWISSGPTPSPDSTTARWQFSAVDPPGGYGMAVYCYFSAPGAAPVLYESCPSPFEVAGLADGSYNLTVHADTLDGRWEALGLPSVVIDTTAPTANLGTNLYVTGDPVLALNVNDQSNVKVLECGLDAATPTPCGEGYVPPYCDPDFGCFPGYYDYRGVQSLQQQGLADGAHTLTVHVVDDRGNEATYDRVFKVDRVAPTLTQTGPTQRFTLATKVTVTWTGSDAVSGIAAYGVRWRRAAYNTDFGAWSTPVTALATATARSFGGLQRGSTYCFAVDAVDKAGNTSPWTVGRCTAIPLDDRDLARSGGWTALKPAGYFLGTALSATRFGSTLSATGATLTRVAVVAKKCSTCGVVGVYVAGKLVSKVNLQASTVSRAVIALPAFELRHGTVTLKVLSSGKLVQIDALGVSLR